MGSGGEVGDREKRGNGGGKCDMRERYARQHREKKIDARRREREENDEMVLWKIASSSGREQRERERSPFSRTAKNSRDAARPVYDR